jgi:hypothetical protein
MCIRWCLKFFCNTVYIKRGRKYLKLLKKEKNIFYNCSLYLFLTTPQVYSVHFTVHLKTMNISDII